MLFNLAIPKLDNILNTVQGSGYTIYADDVAIWSVGSSDGELEAMLQDVVTLTEEYLGLMGLKCCTKKSEMFILKPKKLGRTLKDWVPEADAQN